MHQHTHRQPHWCLLRLQGKLYLQGEYHLNDKHTFGLLFYSDIFRGILDPTVSLSYNLQLGIWNTVASVTYKRGTINNIGLGTSLDMGPMQLYAMVDNLTSLFSPENASRINIQFGLNVAILPRGERKKSKQIDLNGEAFSF